MSRLDELSKDISSVIDKPADIEALAPADETPAEPNIFTQVTILQLYEFAWKCALAALLFAAPFLLLYWAIIFFSK